MATLGYHQYQWNNSEQQHEQMINDVNIWSTKLMHNQWYQHMINNINIWSVISTSLTHDQQHCILSITTSKDPMVNSMETSTGGLLTVSLLRKEITNNGPQINKIKRIISPPPWVNLVTRPVRLPNILELCYREIQITNIILICYITPSISRRFLIA